MKDNNTLSKEYIDMLEELERQADRLGNNLAIVEELLKKMISTEDSES